MRDAANLPFIAIPESNTQAVAPNNSSVSKTIAVPFPKNPAYPGVLRVANPSSSTIFVQQGNGSLTATAADVPVLAGQTVDILLRPDTNAVAVFCASSVTAYVTTGSGGLSA